MPLDPTPSPAQPAAPAPTGTTAPGGQTPPAPAEPPATVTIPLETLQSFTKIQERLARMEEETRARESQAQQEQAAILAKKGEVEAALDILRKQSERELAGARADRSMIEERAKRYALDGEVSRVLASHPLVPGAVDQLTRLLRSEFQVEPAGDSFAVRTPTFVSVNDHIAAILAKPEYAHFVRASNPGGGTGGVSPAGQTAPTQAAQQAAPEAPRTLSDAIILTMKEMGKSSGLPGQADRGGEDGRQMRGAFGLRAPVRQQA